MDQWEYDKIDLNALPRKIGEVDLLNDAGKDEWELIAITAINTAYLKRRIADPAPIKTAPRKVGPAPTA